MKGLKLYIHIFYAVVMSSGAVLAVLNYYNSWSDHVVDPAFRPLLNLMLVMISFVHFFVSLLAKENRKVLTVVFGKPIRLGWALRLTGTLYLGVLVCELNNYTVLLNLAISDSFKITVTYHILHYVFTALAIISSYLTLLFYCDTKKERIWSYLGLAFGAIGFGLGLVLGIYSVSYAELLVAIPTLILLIYIMRKR
jgi:hypothetical protein